MKSNKKEIIIVAIILLIQTIVFAVAGIKKSYMHMDEALSVALTHYDKLYIQDNEAILNTIKEALNLNEITHLERLNSGEVYLIKQRIISKMI